MSLFQNYYIFRSTLERLYSGIAFMGYKDILFSRPLRFLGILLFHALIGCVQRRPLYFTLWLALHTGTNDWRPNWLFVNDHVLCIFISKPMWIIDNTYTICGFLDNDLEQIPWPKIAYSSLLNSVTKHTMRNLYVTIENRSVRSWRPPSHGFVSRIVFRYLWANNISYHPWGCIRPAYL